MISKGESDKADMVKNNKQIEEALQYEIEYFKKEIARLSKGGAVGLITPAGAGGNKNIFLDEGTGSFKNMMGELATPV